MKKTFILALSLSISAYNYAQLVINEFMAGNTITLKDENNEYEDWIEIYNPGNTSVSLNGYYITDNYSKPTKFQLPRTITVPAKGYFIIFADDKTNQDSLHANFKLSLDGEEIGLYKLTGNDTLLIDSISFQAQTNDVSFGRYPDGNEYFEFFASPTPGSANKSGNLQGIAPMPEFSMTGGFYTGQQSIEISTKLAGASIKYTTNGSEPDASSKLYSGAIISDTTFILKAKVFGDKYLSSKTKSSTYFIDEHFSGFNVSERLPVVSISCNKDFLYHPTQGILTNPLTDMEKLVNIEYFEPDGKIVINQNAGLKTFGNASLKLEQKSLAAFARSKYGKGSFDYKFFDNKPFDKYESFVLRNCGSDWSLTYFRDALCQALVRKPMDIDAQGNKHAILYLNGRFYGIVDLKEKVNEHFVEQNCNANPDNIDMLMDDQTLISGDKVKYIEFRNFLCNNDMSNSALYHELDKEMDIKNFMNIQIAQIYIANIDMFLNSKFWRQRENYGKWRWIMYDTELSFGQGDYSYATDYGTIPSSNTLKFASESFGGSNWPYLRSWSSEKLQSILKNESFRDDFIQSFAVHLNTTFKTERVLGMIDSMQHKISKEIPYQIAKYGGHIVAFNPYGYHFTTVEQWEANVDIMRYFGTQRPGYMRSFIIDKFGLTGMYNLTTSIDNQDRGEIFIQGIKVPIDSTGIYFDNIPLKLSASAKQGYKFVKWKGINNIDSLNSEMSLTLSENANIMAVFKPESDAMITELLYLPAARSENEFIEIQNPKHATTIDFSRYSLSGDIKFTFPDSTFIDPKEFIIVALNDTLFRKKCKKVFKWDSGALGDTLGIIVLKDNFGHTIDSIHYTDKNPWPVITRNNSIELVSTDLDNNNGNNWKKGISTGGSPGIPSFTEAVKSLKINEFLADNVDFNADEHNEYNDWIEILNTGNEPVDMGGLFLTNDLKVPAMYQIPVNFPEITVIKPGEHKILWADNEEKQGALHLGFKLSASGGEIGISADGQSFLDSATYLSQTSNVSQGRYLDGEHDWKSFIVPTPGLRNSYAPVITSEPALRCEGGKQYTYNFTATDEDGDDLIVGFYSKPYWATISYVDNGNVILKGTMPDGTAQNYSVNLFVTDGNSKPVIQSFIIQYVVPVGLKESIASNGINCYPNPTNGVVNIESIFNSPIINITVNNIAGQVVLSKQTRSKAGKISDKIDLSGQTKGIYFLTITVNEGTITKKIILN